MQPAHFTLSAERTATGYIAYCRELEMSCEGRTEDEARQLIVQAIALLFDAPPAEEVDLRLPEPQRVKQVNIRK